MLSSDGTWKAAPALGGQTRVSLHQSLGDYRTGQNTQPQVENEVQQTTPGTQITISTASVELRDGFVGR